jgi:hypothetical protein
MKIVHLIRDPIDELDSSKRDYCIEMPTFKTKLRDGPYDAVACRECGLSLDGDLVVIYQRAKARLWVKGHEFVPYTVENVCSELAEPHPCALEGVEMLDHKTVLLGFVDVKSNDQWRHGSHWSEARWLQLSPFEQLKKKLFASTILSGLTTLRV